MFFTSNRNCHFSSEIGETQNGLLIFLGKSSGKRHIPNKRKSSRISSNKLQQQRQTMEIVEDLECEDKHFRNLLRFRICFGMFLRVSSCFHFVLHVFSFLHFFIFPFQFLQVVFTFFLFFLFVFSNFSSISSRPSRRHNRKKIVEKFLC